MVGILLDRGADPNAGFLLHDAALKGFAGVAELLLAHGAKVDVDPARATPLHDAALAGNTSVIAILLNKGANINTGMPTLGQPRCTTQLLGDAPTLSVFC